MDVIYLTCLNCYTFQNINKMVLSLKYRVHLPLVAMVDTGLNKSESQSREAAPFPGSFSLCGYHRRFQVETFDKRRSGLRPRVSTKW